MKKLGSHVVSKKTLGIGLIVCMSLFLISFASAMDFDNVKSEKQITFDGESIIGNKLLEEYKPIQIDNLFGLGSVLFEGYIDKHTESCGADCESIIKVKTGQDGALIDDVIFRTLQEDDGWIEQDVRSYQFYINTGNEKIDIDDYETQCDGTGTSPNGTEIENCQRVKVGSHKEDAPVWTPYNIGEEVEKGTYQIKLEAEKEPIRTVDWVIKTNGEWLESWAAWESTFSDDLIIAYTFEETAGTIVIDQQDNYNGTNNGGDLQQIGINNYGYNFTQSSDDYLNISNFQVIMNETAGTFSLWFYPLLCTNNYFIYHLNTEEADERFNFGTTTGVGTECGLGGGFYTLSPSVAYGDTSIDLFSWNNIIVSWDGTDVNITVNGFLNYTSGYTPITSSEEDFHLSHWYDGSLQRFFDGTLDEFYWWNRTLTPTEIATLYDSGTGTFFVQNEPTVVLNYPADNNVTKLTNIEFNATATATGAATLVNMSLWTNETGSWAIGNTTIVTGTTNTTAWNRSLSDGSSTLWNVQSCDSDGDCAFASSNYSLSIDLTSPTMVIQSPNGTYNYSEVGLNETLNITFTDSNLDTCWYNYNGTNYTIDGCLTGVKNSTKFLLEEDNLNMTIYANDSVGNLNTTFINWSYKLLQTAEYFVSSTTSGATNPFNITLDSNSQITIAYLNYNNTAVLGSISSSGNTYVLSKDQIAPGVSAATNISFYWNLTRADGFNYTATAQNQTVSPIVINETCAGMYTIFNFTLVDELTQVKINGVAENSSIKTDLTLYNYDGDTELSSFSNEYNATNPAAICIDNNLSGGERYLLDLQVQYSTDNHSDELYHIENYILNSSSLSQNITLYDLPTVSSQKFELLARDTSYIPIDGALIKIGRKYIENGSFFTTEIPRTDAKGITSASLETDDVIYNFYIYDNGELISTFTNVLAICQTPLVSTCKIDFNAFQTGISIPDYEDGDDFNFTIGYNSTSKVISSVFTIPSGEPSTIRLEVISEDTLGTSVCEDTLTSASGTLICTVPSSFGNSTVLAKIYKTGVEQGRGNVKLDQSSSDIFGPILIMLSVLVMLTLIGIGISDNPIISAVFLFVGVLLLFSMNLVQSTGFYGAGATILFLGIAIILVIIKAARRT